MGGLSLKDTIFEYTIKLITILRYDFYEYRHYQSIIKANKIT